MEFIQDNANTYTTIKKIISIHSEDRDITKYTNPSLFEIQLPADYKNIVSMNLDSIDIPKSFKVFSNYLQNTKLTFNVIPTHILGTGFSSVTFNVWDTIVGNALLKNKDGYIITIEEGNYTIEQLLNQICGLMNKAITDYLLSIDINVPYTYFTLFNHEISSKLWFGNSRDFFYLDFTKDYHYDCGNQAIFNQYSLWGLGSYLGFNKLKYASTSSFIPIEFYWNNTIWLQPFDNNPVFFIEPPFSYNLTGYTQMYLELSGYNSIDEISPYTERSSNMYNSKYNGSVDLAFAKIPIDKTTTITPNYNLTNSFFSDPPLERLQKLKVKLRYHNGVLVDLGNHNFNFSISFNILRPDILKNIIVTKPPTYLVK